MEMEKTNYRSKSSIPTFAQGLSVLVVDQETRSRMHLSSLLEQYNYSVTTTEFGVAAVSMILAQPNLFKIIMVSMELHDLDITVFMKTVERTGIPIIVMSSENNIKAAVKALQDGAYYYLEKPILPEYARQVWQYAMSRRRPNETTPGARPASYVRRENREESSRKVVLEVVKISEGTGVSTARKEAVNVGPNAPKREKKAVDQGKIGNGVGKNQANMDPLGMSKSSQNTPVSKRKEPNAGAENGKSKVRKTRFGEEDDEDDKGENSAKKQRLVWNPDLKSKFTAAVNALGKNDARPKTILNMMDVPDLTQRQVASHLQKYKAQAQPLPESKFPLTSLLLGNQINDSGPALPMRENSSLLQSRSLQNRAHNSSSFRQFRSSSQRLQINNARVQAGSSRPWLQNSNSVLQPGSPALAMPGNNSVLQPESPMLAMQGNNPVRRPGSASSLNLQNNISMLQSGSSGNMQHNISLLQPGFPFRWQQTDVPMLHPGANENYLMHINNSLLQIGSSFNNVQNNASRMQVGSSFGVQTHTSILQPGSSLNWVQNNLPMFQRTPSFNFWGNNKLLQCESLLDEPDEDLLLYHGPLPQWLQETLLVLRQGSSSSSHGFQNYISILQPGFSSHSMNWVPSQLGGGNSGLPSGGIFPFGSQLPSIAEDEELMLILASFSQDIPLAAETLEGIFNQGPHGSLVPPLFSDNTSSHVPPDGNLPPPTSQSQNQDITDHQSLQNLLDNEEADTTGNSNDPTPEEVEQFCEWLVKVLVGDEE